MKKIELTILISLLLVLPIKGAFNLNDVGMGGTALKQTECNTATLINFYWSTNTVSSGYASGAKGAITNTAQSTFGWRDTSGADINMTLQDFSWSAAGMTTYVTNYQSSPAITIAGAAVFKYTSTVSTTTVYVYIPVATTGSASNADVIDLTDAAKSPSHTFSRFDGNGNLNSCFSFLNHNNYNQWYTQSSGTNVVLVSRYIYKVSSASNLQSSLSTPASTLNAITFGSTTAKATGDKLCYASASNFRSSLRSIVAFWFIWFGIFIYWLIYLFSDSVTKSCFDRENFTENIWTCWSLYSIVKVAQEQFFTKLSRMTVVLNQLTIQGLFIAAIIYSQYSKGPAIVIWSAVIAWVATIVFPFIWGHAFHKKIYSRYRLKFQTKKRIMEAKQKNRPKEEIKPLQEEIDVLQEKIYGYYHWFYCITFALLILCWPITIHLMQELPRTEFSYNWYWLAALAITFFIEHFIYEPILICLFHNKRAVKHRGGYYYDIRLGETYSEVSEF